MVQKLQEPDIKPHLEKILPTDNVANATFSTNFFTSFGLGIITEQMWEFIENAPKILLEWQLKELEELEIEVPMVTMTSLVVAGHTGPGTMICGWHELD